MAIVNAPRKKQKKHGKKTFVRPSQKKSVKNGRHQEKEAPKKKPVKKVKPTATELDEALAKELDAEDHEEFFGDLPDEDFNDEEMSLEGISLEEIE